ncbi:MAG TPA: thiamine ABC transporter substrate-binding protein [Nocardioides sp.]|nr:thiamine ABC transporter substrate-binding protein [Nocardioides sp.]
MRSTVALVAALALATTSCSLIGDDDDSSGGDGADELVLVTHDSFSLPDELVAAFEKESGFELEIRQVGDGGTLTNELVLTKDSPLGDVAFGVDNTFASRALDEGVFAPYDFDAPAGVDDHALPGDDEHALTAVDNANVCVNVDNTWFADQGIAPPESLDDLTDPAYRDLFVTPGATTSTPGMAFLLSTIAEYGDSWTTYWEDLVANGAKLTKGWEDAYNVDFTQGGGDGERPIVLSYDSSPAFTVADGKSSTSALLDTCFEQVEYAGVIEGAENPEGGRELVEFLVSPEVQAALPTSMYVFPVAEGVELPKEWAEFAVQPTEPYAVDPAEVAANRETWLREWSDVTSR